MLIVINNLTRVAFFPFSFRLSPFRLCTGSQKAQRGWQDVRGWLQSVPVRFWGQYQEARAAEICSALLQSHWYPLPKQGGFLQETTAVQETQGLSQAMSWGGSKDTPRLICPALGKG